MLSDRLLVTQCVAVICLALMLLTVCLWWFIMPVPLRVEGWVYLGGWLRYWGGISPEYSKVIYAVIAVRNVLHHYGNSRAIWDHTVLPAIQQRWPSHLYPSQLKLVLDLATPGGDTRLSWPSWLGYISKWYTHLKMVTHPSTNRCRVTSLIRRMLLLLKHRLHV